MTVIKNIAKDRILQITVVITIISLFFARPRIEDINFHTLYSILAMLTIIQIFSYLHVLDVLAYKLTASARSTRRLTAIFTILSIISAMFLTNDITVLTLIPLYLTIARRHHLPEILPVTLIGMAQILALLLRHGGILITSLLLTVIMFHQLSFLVGQFHYY